MRQVTTRISNLTDAPPRQPTFLAVGVFDGVHLGHQALLRQMVEAANEAGVRSAVLSFYPHPVSLIHNLSGRLYLQRLSERLDELAKLGPDLIITQTFDETLRQTHALDYVEELCQTLDMRQLWGGHFSLGYQREGNADFLSRLGEEKDFSVRQVTGLVSWRDARISSSRIRHALQQGDLETVTQCLGRRYVLSGEVIAGRKLGRTIGFPTANIAVWEQQLLPANGVYAAYATVAGRRYVAAANVGLRPTVDGDQLSVEAHLLDCSADLYGQWMDLAFVHRIRDERKFEGLPALVAQIEQDVALVRRQIG